MGEGLGGAMDRSQFDIVLGGTPVAERRFDPSRNESLTSKLAAVR
jgi:hypothetical protein